MFQDDPEVLHLCVRVCLCMSLFGSACINNGVVCRERRGREKERERVSELSGWGGVREGRMDVFDG